MEKVPDLEGKVEERLFIQDLEQKTGLFPIAVFLNALYVVGLTVFSLPHEEYCWALSIILGVLILVTFVDLINCYSLKVKPILSLKFHQVSAIGSGLAAALVWISTAFGLR